MEPFYRMQTDIEEVLEMSISYSEIISVLAFAALHQVMMERLLSATGKANLTMVSMLVGAVSIPFPAARFTPCLSPSPSFFDNTELTPTPSPIPMPTARYWTGIQSAVDQHFHYLLGICATFLREVWHNSLY